MWKVADEMKVKQPWTHVNKLVSPSWDTKNNEVLKIIIVMKHCKWRTGLFRSCHLHSWSWVPRDWPWQGSDILELLPEQKQWLVEGRSAPLWGSLWRTWYEYSQISLPREDLAMGPEDSQIYPLCNGWACCINCSLKTEGFGFISQCQINNVSHFIRTSTCDVPAHVTPVAPVTPVEWVHFALEVLEAYVVNKIGTAIHFLFHENDITESAKVPTVLRIIPTT